MHAFGRVVSMFAVKKNELLAFAQLRSLRNWRLLGVKDVLTIGLRVSRRRTVKHAVDPRLAVVLGVKSKPSQEAQDARL